MAFDTDISGWEAFASAERARGAEDDEAVMGAIYRALKTGTGADKVTEQLHAATTLGEQRRIRETVLWPLMDAVRGQYVEIVAGLGLKEIPVFESANRDPDYSVHAVDMSGDSWLEIFQENDAFKARAAAKASEMDGYKRGMTIVPESRTQVDQRENQGTIAELEAWSQTFGMESTGTGVSEDGVGTQLKNWFRNLVS